MCKTFACNYTVSGVSTKYDTGMAPYVDKCHDSLFMSDQVVVIKLSHGIIMSDGPLPFFVLIGS